MIVDLDKNDTVCRIDDDENPFVSTREESVCARTNLHICGNCFAAVGVSRGQIC